MFLKNYFFFSKRLNEMQNRNENKYWELDRVSRIYWNQRMVKEYRGVMSDRVASEGMVDCEQAGGKKDKTIPL